jgi:prepilin-type N-terminal cleavage/methylation domain-containing protein
MHESRRTISPRAPCGFTLIEMLIVIAIIGILAGLLFPVVVMFRQDARIKATRMRLVNLRGALETYRSRFGDYPPSSLGPFGPGATPNDTNLGIESATACLASNADGRSPLGKIAGEEGFFGNTDDDAARRNVTAWYFGDNRLREILDEWEQPFVYFHARDYTRPAACSRYKIGGKVQVCAPGKDAATGAFRDANRYQLWSVGPDGVNENGTGDDIIER